MVLFFLPHTKFYFYRLFLFYVQSIKDFKSIDEANRFLDSPKEKHKIKEEIEKLKLALKMHGKE
jgi:hypothetical protein